MKLEWDLTHFFKDEEEYRKKLAKMDQLLLDYETKIETCLENKESFEEVLSLHLNVNEQLEKFYCYAKRHTDLDAYDAKWVEQFNRALTLKDHVDKINQQYFSYVKNHEDFVLELLKEKDLSMHQLYIERILERKRLETKENIKEEESHIDSVLRSLPFTYRKILENEVYPKIKNEEGKKETTKYTFLSKNRELRKKSYQSSKKVMKKSNDILASFLDMKISSTVLFSSLEGFPNALARSIFNDELPYTVVERLLDKVKEQVDINHQYIYTLKEFLDYDTFFTYDLAYPIVHEEQTYPIKDAYSIILRALKPLGEDYQEGIKKAFHEGWIDLYPKKGKRADSVSMITFTGVPYLLLNYKEDLFSLRSLIHELGHSIHSYYAKNHQPFEYFEYNLFIAEISSMVNEEFLYDDLLSHALNIEEKLSILKRQTMAYRNSLFSNSILANFERDMYQEKEKGKLLTANDFNTCYLKYVQLFYGDEVTLKEDDSYDWQRISQFFLNQPFYIWKYVMDRLIAIYVFTRIKEDISYLEKYKSFLKAGNSMKTLDLLQLLEIDIESFNFFDQAIEHVRKMMNLYQELLKK